MCILGESFERVEASVVSYAMAESLGGRKARWVGELWRQRKSGLEFQGFRKEG